jgi:hypothetical protein
MSTSILSAPVNRSRFGRPGAAASVITYMELVPQGGRDLRLIESKPGINPMATRLFLGQRPERLKFAAGPGTIA